VNEKFRKKRNISLYYNYKMIGVDFDLLLATATYDKTNEIVYAAIEGVVPFSIGDYVVIINGSSFLAKVEAFETMGDGATVRLSFDDIWGDFFWNSGSEKQVLLKGLSNSKELEKPSATINVAAVPTPAALSALKRQIALGTTTFAQAFDEILDTSSQATVRINQGNPKTMVETFFADKVKAKFSTKGLQFSSEKKIGKIFTSDQPVKQVLLPDYLRDMRLASREEDGFFHFFTVTLVDKNLNVIASKKQIKEVIRFKNNGEIGYRLRFEDELPIQFSGTCTVLIEKETVDKNDLLDWSGSNGIIPAPYLGIITLNKERPLEVKYLKKYDGIAFDYLELEIPEVLLNWNNKITSLTVDGTTIYGSLKLTEDNKYDFIKPAGMGQLAWGKGLAAFLPSGKGILVPLEQGSLAKDEMLQLNVELGNVEDAFEFLKAFQATTTTSVAQLLPQLGQLKVLNADVAAAKAGVNILTGIETLATGTVKWFNDAKYFEITVKNNSKEMFNVFNSNGADEGFQEVGVARFLDMAVADVKETYEKELQYILSTQGSAVGGDTVWTADFQIIGERFQIVFRNAEVIPSTSGRKYRLFYDQGMIPIADRLFYDQGMIPIAAANRYRIGFTRTEVQLAL
jgi:hypothetical protein